MKQTQSGMILLMVLLIFAVVAILASTMISQLSVDAERSSGMAAYQQGRAFALGAEDAVKQGLYLDWEANSAIDHLGEEWAIDRAFPLEPGYVSIHISDLQGRFNLNSMVPGATADIGAARFRNLLNLLGLDLEIANYWRAWLNPESQADDVYYTHTPPYRAAYQSCRHTSELMLLPDVTLEVYKRLEPFIACLPPQTPLNVNTAPEIIIAALDSRLTPDLAQQITIERGTDGFEDVQSFMTLGPITPFTRIEEGEKEAQTDTGEPWVDTDFAVSSQFFEVFIRVDLAGRVATMESAIFRATTDGAMTTMYRDYSRREARSGDILPTNTLNE
ncbi:MAG: hypothetical protein CMI00_08920 [Oceanospirillaceae bacterium]|nr:hypothetical protein [Oceanospirillaceae bacterium]|tara:strand:- start:25518 stop:26513 length:996 start_codon:yes stop_codon:yes gene_type:complete